MAYFDKRPMHSGKTTTDEVYSLNTLTDKVVFNALLAGASFTKMMAIGQAHATNSPVIAYGGSKRSDRWSTCVSYIGSDLRGNRGVGSPITSLASIRELDGLWFKEPTRSVKFEVISSQIYNANAASPFFFTSISKSVKNTLLSNIKKAGEADDELCLRIWINDDYECYAHFAEFGTALCIVSAFADWTLLNHPDLLLSGVGFFSTEGTIDMPDKYVTLKVLESSANVESSVYNKLAERLSRSCALWLTTAVKKVYYTCELDDAADFKVCGDFITSITGDKSVTLSSNLDLDETDVKRFANQAREIGITFIKHKVPYTIQEIDELILHSEDMIASIAVMSADKNLQRLLWLVKAIRKRTGGFSIDPVDCNVSSDRVSFVDREGKFGSVEGSPLSILLSIPGFFFFDSFGSVVFSSQGSALPGGLSSDVFTSLYHSTYSHGILNYASVNEGGQYDPLLRFDLGAMTSGTLIYTDPKEGVPQAISITSRLVNRRNSLITFAKIVEEGTSGVFTVEYNYPKQIFGLDEDFKFRSPIKKEVLASIMVSRSVDDLVSKDNGKNTDQKSDGIFLN